MCGRYIPNTEQEIMEIREILREISIRISFDDAAALGEPGDVFPSTDNPVITLSSGVAKIQKVKWGFTKWDNKGILINAKSETAARSRFFSPYMGNRCLVPAHGYYEWQTMDDKSKIKYIFTSDEKCPIFMAGIYRPFQGGTEYVILTKSAQKSIDYVHSRMPLIIGASQLGDWLNPRTDISQFLTDCPNIVCEKAV